MTPTAVTRGHLGASLAPMTPGLSPLTSRMNLPLRLPLSLLFAAITLACTSRDKAPPDTALAANAAVAGSESEAASCDTPIGGVRVTGTRIAGLPVTTGLHRLRELCPNARREDPEDAPEEAIGMGIDFPGVRVRATFAASPADSADDSAPVSWAVSGDSIRFPDGRLVPRTLGALRQLDTLGLVEPSDSEFRPDDMLVHLCSYPDLLIVVAPGSTRPAGEGPWTLAEFPARDTARIREVVVVPGPRDAVFNEWRSMCPSTTVRGPSLRVDGSHSGG